jgi:hypothetical protein
MPKISVVGVDRIEVIKVVQIVEPQIRFCAIIPLSGRGNVALSVKEAKSRGSTHRNGAAHGGYPWMNQTAPRRDLRQTWAATVKAINETIEYLRGLEIGDSAQKPQ